VQRLAQVISRSVVEKQIGRHDLRVAVAVAESIASMAGRSAAYHDIIDERVDLGKSGAADEINAGKG
jgi:hypothetical protein